ncbi:deoxyribose-phosphate aldolase [Clostridiales bacterium COT073_COT-073]|nr:deoxyribose-phosphate aldolase [Clostridiales bacterium COT073_COT-073]
MGNGVLTADKLAEMIDQTLLKPFVTYAQLREHCEKSMEYGFKTVAINNAAVPFCNKILKNSKVVCDAAVSFPLGQCTLDTKVFETEDVIKKGAKEVDYVINLTELKSGNYDYIEKEMNAIISICRQYEVVSKVIFENCYLTEEEKKKLCVIALKVKPDFIKTSTGFGTGGATVEDVKLMKSMVGEEVKIKAAGGIRTFEDAMRMIEAGASRIGTSCGIEIVEGFKKSREG